MSEHSVVVGKEANVEAPEWAQSRLRDFDRDLVFRFHVPAQQWVVAQRTPLPDNGLGRKGGFVVVLYVSEVERLSSTAVEAAIETLKRNRIGEGVDFAQVYLQKLAAERAACDLRTEAALAEGREVMAETAHKIMYQDSSPVGLGPRVAPQGGWPVPSREAVVTQ